MRKLAAIGVVILTIGIFYKPLYTIALLSSKTPLMSHIPLIPCVSLYLIWMHRKRFFSDIRYAPYAGTGLMILSLAIYIFQHYQFGELPQIDALFVSIGCFIIWVMGGFMLLYGRAAFVKAFFPLAFLCFIIPLPSWLLSPVVHFLQIGSTYATKGILKLVGVPAYFEGFFISLPGVTVEVAEECSGIRSAVALFILSIFAGHMFLKSTWRRVCLSLCIIPITLLKNGMRISMLAILGSYVDMSYLTDSVLHSWGGKPFFVVAILMSTPILWFLIRSEQKSESKSNENNHNPKVDDRVEYLKTHGSCS